MLRLRSLSRLRPPVRPLPDSVITRVRVRAALVLALAAVLVACGCGGTPPVAADPPPAGATAPEAPAANLAAAERVRLEVPEGLAGRPLDTPRELAVPPGWSARVIARVPNARFLARTPQGDVLVSQPGQGRVLRIRGRADAAADVAPLLEGLRTPHDLVFHEQDGRLWLYLAESHRVVRYPWEDLTAGRAAPEVLVTGLPDDSTPELRGSYAHALKNIAVDSEHRLYVSIASSCNACLEDVRADPMRGAIHRYAPDGSGRELFARGIRNAEGLAFAPGTDDLWVTINQRDNTPFPFHRDITGDGEDDYGRVIPAWVDDHPPDALTRVREGSDHGWPFCLSDPDTPSGLSRMPYVADVQHNAGGAVDCGAMAPVERGIQAHSAPLGLSFWGEGAVTALHGSWNRREKTGYGVAYFPFDAETGTMDARVDLATGWLDGDSSWGRPVDAIGDGAGGLLVSDDAAGAVYRLRPPAG